MFDLEKKMKKLIEMVGSDRIVIFTNHLKIDGIIYPCDEKCKESGECIVTLKDAVVCKLDDYCTCDEDGCECNDYVCFKYDMLNINIGKIVAFSLLK